MDPWPALPANGCMSLGGRCVWGQSDPELPLTAVILLLLYHTMLPAYQPLNRPTAGLPVFSTQALANSVWAAARLGYLHRELMQGVALAVAAPGAPRTLGLNAQNWANIAW